MASAGRSARLYVSPYMRMMHPIRYDRLQSILTHHAQVRFNVLRVLPRTGKAVKQFNKF